MTPEHGVDGLLHELRIKVRELEAQIEALTNPKKSVTKSSS